MSGIWRGMNSKVINSTTGKECTPREMLAQRRCPEHHRLISPGINAAGYQLWYCPHCEVRVVEHAGLLYLPPE